MLQCGAIGLALHVPGAAMTATTLCAEFRIKKRDLCFMTAALRDKQ
jgi:hypothetical protein